MHIRNPKQKLYAFGIIFSLMFMSSVVYSSNFNPLGTNPYMEQDINMDIYWDDTDSGTDSLSIQSLDPYARPVAEVVELGGRQLFHADASSRIMLDGENGGYRVMSNDNETASNEKTIEEEAFDTSGFPSYLNVKEVICSKFENKNATAVSMDTNTGSNGDIIYFAETVQDTVFTEVKFGLDDDTYDTHDVHTLIPEDGYYWLTAATTDTAKIQNITVTTKESTPVGYVLQVKNRIYDHRSLKDVDETFKDANASSRIYEKSKNERATTFVGTKNLDDHYERRAKKWLADHGENPSDFIGYNISGYDKSVMNAGRDLKGEKWWQVSFMGLSIDVGRSIEWMSWAQLGAFGDFGDSFSNTIQSVSTTVSDSINDVQQTFSDTTEQVSEKTSDWASDAGDSITQTINSGWNATVGGADTIQSAVEDTYDDATDMASTGIDNLADAGSQSFDMLTDQVEQIQSSLTNVGESIADSVASTVGNATSWMGESIAGVKEQIGSKFYELSHGVQQAVGGVTSTIGKVVSGLKVPLLIVLGLIGVVIVAIVVLLIKQWGGGMPDVGV